MNIFFKPKYEDHIANYNIDIEYGEDNLCAFIILTFMPRKFYIQNNFNCREIPFLSNRNYPL